MGQGEEGRRRVVGKALPTRDVQGLMGSVLRKGVGKFAGVFLPPWDPLFTDQV